MPETITVERAGGVVTVTLNRPTKKNAITGQMLDVLTAACEQVNRNPGDRAVVLTGAGGDFSSGADLTDPDMDVGADRPFLLYMRRVADTVLRLHRLLKPTIAKVDGVAVGLGMNMALACDLVVASDRARFAEIFPKRGLAVDGGGSWSLPRRIGLHKAKELALLGEIVPATAAEAMALVNKVVPADQLDAAVDEWARRLAAGPTLALSLTKGLLNNSAVVSMDQALEDEARAQHVTFSTQDVARAMAAFARREEPEFLGR